MHSAKIDLVFYECNQFFENGKDDESSVINQNHA